MWDQLNDALFSSTTPLDLTSEYNWKRSHIFKQLEKTKNCLMPYTAVALLEVFNDFEPDQLPDLVKLIKEEKSLEESINTYSESVPWDKNRILRSIQQHRPRPESLPPGSEDSTDAHEPPRDTDSVSERPLQHQPEVKSRPESSPEPDHKESVTAVESPEKFTVSDDIKRIKANLGHDQAALKNALTRAGSQLRLTLASEISKKAINEDLKQQKAAKLNEQNQQHPESKELKHYIKSLTSVIEDSEKRIKLLEQDIDQINGDVWR